MFLCTTKAAFLISTHSFPNVGWILKTGTRVTRFAIKQHTSASPRVFETVLINRSYKFDLSDARLAIVEFKMTFVTFVWRFEARFKREGQAGPKYENTFLVNRGPLKLILTLVDRSTHMRKDVGF